MISIRSLSELQRAWPLDATALKVMLPHLEQLTEYDLLDFSDIVHFIVVEAGDDLATIEGVAGVPLATSYIDGTRYGDPDFSDNFEFVERHGDWFEAVIILNDDGFGVVLLVPDRPDIDPTLRGLVRDRR